MNKIAVGLTVLMLALCLLLVALDGTVTVTSQTGAQPASSAPASSAAAATTRYSNRPLSRWEISHMVWLTTLIRDTKMTVDNLANMNMANAEAAFPQLLCEIRTLQGRTPPDYSPRADISGDPWWVETTRPRSATSGTWKDSRNLWAAPAGYRSPPIADAQAAADLNLALAQLETAINHITTGLNTANASPGTWETGSGLIQLGTAEMIEASATLEKVIEDLGIAQ